MVEHDDDLAPTKTEGYKIGEKKTIEEYQKLGAAHNLLISSLIQPPLLILHRKTLTS
jgi:hypothetical protein